MPNMSYCRFENTLGDLRDCLDADKPTSISEMKARLALYHTCERFVRSFDPEMLQDELQEAIEEQKRERELPAGE